MRIFHHTTTPPSNLPQVLQLYAPPVLVMPEADLQQLGVLVEFLRGEGPQNLTGALKEVALRCVGCEGS